PSKYNTEFGDYNNGKIIAKIYQAYEVALKKNNAFDFDDLLIKAYQLLRDNSDVSEYYQDKFRYIHVDEFQDTNTIQYELLKILGAKHRNIFCVGDEDQSIYKWRGAKIENIGSFANDFRCTVYKLEQNYRSGQNILTIANEIIKNNTNRFHDPKELKSNKQNKGEINFFKAYDEKDEASYVIGRILRLKSEGDYRYGDFAVLSRLNATMRPFEEKLMEYGIPYKIFGGFKFYERKEIKDLLAYLKIIANPYDNEAILRVINFPKRGIGSTAIEQFIDIVSETGGRLFERIVEAEKDISIPSKLAKKIASFGRVLSNFAEASKRMGISELAEYVVGALDLQTVYSGDTDEDKARWLNINDFLAGLADYEKRNPDATLDNYLQNVSLYSDLDEMDSNDFVNIATVHSAKGLEFKVVFVIGLEEGIFPIERRGGDSDIEEERRLMYVAVTRAMERLYLTRAGSRFMYGQRNYTNPSIFLAEADPKKNIERELPTYAKSEPIKHYNQETFSPVKKAEDNITKDISGYKVGSTVKHRKFGIGKVISISDSVGGAHAEINFEGVGTLTLALNYAPIELVE
ncbi:MAG: ATP-dependent helicase, partial [Firmicutes bacterium]|nr:ATP-dependent helicase [Bacillota bacterium]